MIVHAETRRMIRNAFVHFKDLAYNLMYFTDRSPAEEGLSLLRNLVLSLPDGVRERYRPELEYVERLPLDELQCMLFPYPLLHSHESFSSDHVKLSRSFPCVDHVGRDGGSVKLFFARSMSLAEVAKAYDDLVNVENIIGDGVSPHSYQDADHCVEEGDVILDIGCAEALFALDNVGKASKVYLFEASREWKKPLALTFSPYLDKTVLVEKLVSDETTKSSTRIADAVKTDENDNLRFFVKMDIEGWERCVIKGNADFFTKHRIKLSCCVYHRQDDARVIESMLKGMGYKTRFSDGYMLSTMNGMHFPYFRRGVLYARNF